MKTIRRFKPEEVALLLAARVELDLPPAEDGSTRSYIPTVCISRDHKLEWIEIEVKDE